MATQNPDKIGGLLLKVQQSSKLNFAKTRDNLALMNMIFADGYKGDVDESSLLQSLLNKAHLNIKVTAFHHIEFRVYLMNLH